MRDQNKNIYIYILIDLKVVVVVAVYFSLSSITFANRVIIFLKRKQFAISNIISMCSSVI